jgi:hypothetical protein
MKFDWKLFINKTWNMGIKEALQDVVNNTDNKFDDLGIAMIDKFIDGYFK